MNQSATTEPFAAAMRPGPDGAVDRRFTIEGTTLDGGDRALFDGDGAAVLLVEERDGRPYACGVLRW